VEETNLDRRGTHFDGKGVLSFLSITFVITYVIEGILILHGFRVTRLPALYGQLTVVAVMWVPALATWLTIRFITHEGFAVANIRFGSWKPYVTAGLVVPACFVIIYAVTWAVGLGRPDWKLEQFLAMIASHAPAGAAPMASPALMLPVTYVAMLVMAPFINGLFGFGEELGWRGYLLPKLMVLGKPRAYLLLGIVWGLWHLPLVLVGFTYPGHRVLGVLAFIALTTTFGIYLNELTLRHRSSILAGWVHGVFNSQKLGVWGLLFPSVNPLLGGFAGIIGIVVWLALGVWEMQRKVA
jgi:hypothetical protein